MHFLTQLQQQTSTVSTVNTQKVPAMHACMVKHLMACRPLFRRSGFLFILIALWPLTFFKHGYDGYHKASLVNSCAFGNGITENKASNFASCPWNHNGLIIRTARGKGYFSARINYHSCCVSGLHLIRLFISEDVCLNPGPDK